MAIGMGAASLSLGYCLEYSEVVKLLWCALLFFGFVPLEDGLPVGPPSIRSDASPAVQWRMSARPRWREFREEWPGIWAVRWDTGRGSPRMLWAPGVAATQGTALAEAVAELGGVDKTELVGPRVQQAGARRIWHWDRIHKGALVVGDRVALVEVDGHIGGVWAQLTPVPDRLKPAPGQVIFPLPPRGEAVLAVQTREGPHMVFRDAGGKELYRYETRMAATVDISVEERTVGDPLIQVPARQVRVRGGDETWTTDDDGEWPGGTPDDVIYNGPLLRVRNNGDNIVVEVPIPLEEPWVIEAGVDVPYAANTVLHHFHVTWDWLGDLWPTHPWLSERMLATVLSDEDLCNAWYNGTSITFLQADPARCHDFGRIADVVYHELGHAVHHRILATGTYDSAISEGSSDYLSATINDDPRVGINAYPDGSAVRNIGPDHRYPEDYVEESHYDGLIWASFLWNLRSEWSAESEDGVIETDLLFLRALEQGPNLFDVYEAVLLADDDDGDLTDGTPHDCELMDRLGDHGIGPGPIGVVMFDHVPLEAQESAVDGYEVAFMLTEVAPDCGDLDRDSVRIWYATDDVAAPGLVVSPPVEDPEEPDTGSDHSDTGLTDPDTGLDDPDTGAPEDMYLGWEMVDPADSGEHWLGIIPRQPANTHVRYFIEAASTDGTQIIQTHEGRADFVWDFWVGDRTTVWCDGFEEDGASWTHAVGWPTLTEAPESWVSEWEFASPGGSTWGPDAAYEGERIAVTGLDTEYINNNAQQLISPVLDLSGAGLMTMLTTRRWLTVEDALYDQAEIWANDTMIWQNPATATGQRHLLDERWTQHDILLDGRLETPEDTTLAWVLRSDMGLEFGGWALDEVCVTTLDDVPGHYRVGDLTASVDLPEVEITWTQPWVTPLLRTVLVRSDAAPPTGPEDGEVIHTDTAPSPGAAHAVLDADIAPDWTYYYAIFTEGPQAGEWTELVVLGENLALGGDLRSEEDTGGPGLTDDTGLSDDTGLGDDTGHSGDSGSPDDTGGADDTGQAPDTGEAPSEPESSDDTGAEQTEKPGVSLSTLSDEKGTCGCAAAASSPGGSRAGWAFLGGLLGLWMRRRHHVYRRPAV